MSQNKLKHNADVLVIGAPAMRAKMLIPSITINVVIVQVLNEPVGNVGVVFDQDMDMSAHVLKEYQLFKLPSEPRNNIKQEVFSMMIQSRVQLCHVDIPS